MRAVVRAFNPLFKSEDPTAHPEGFLADINPNSEQVYENAFIETGFEEVRRSAPWPKDGKEGSTNGGGISPDSIRFQGMRVAYFTVDKDSTPDRIVLNRIVTLKDTLGKS